jgi:hypothetical protein
MLLKHKWNRIGIQHSQTFVIATARIGVGVIQLKPRLGCESNRKTSLRVLDECSTESTEAKKMRRGRFYSVVGGSKKRYTPIRLTKSNRIFAYAKPAPLQIVLKVFPEEKRCDF